MDSLTNAMWIPGTRRSRSKGAEVCVGGVFDQSSLLLYWWRYSRPSCEMICALLLAPASRYLVQEIDSPTWLESAVKEEKCVVITQVRWSAESVWKSHRVSEIAERWKGTKLGSVSFFILDLTQPHPDFVTDWLRTHPSISPHSFGGTGEIVCMRNGTPIGIIHHFETIELLEEKIQQCFTELTDCKGTGRSPIF